MIKTSMVLEALVQITTSINPFSTIQQFKEVVRMMMRRFALFSGIAVLSAVAFASKAGAQTADVDFGGQIQGVCFFSSVTAGILELGSNSPSYIEATGINGPYAALGTNGKVGGVAVSCTTGGQLSVGLPTQITAPTGFSETIKQSIAYDQNTAQSTMAASGGTLIASGGTAPLPLPASGAFVPVSVGMAVGSPTGPSVPSGTYLYRVTLTATPN